MKKALNKLLLLLKVIIIIIIINAFMEHLWYSRHYSNLYKWITPFTLHDKPMKWILFPPQKKRLKLRKVRWYISRANKQWQNQLKNQCHILFGKQHILKSLLLVITECSTVLKHKKISAKWRNEKRVGVGFSYKILH